MPQTSRRHPVRSNHRKYGRRKNSMSRETVLAALDDYGQEQFRAGLLAGLAVAERIQGGLTAQPDSARQRQQREWAETAIAEAKQKHGM